MYISKNLATAYAQSINEEMRKIRKDEEMITILSKLFVAIDSDEYDKYFKIYLVSLGALIGFGVAGLVISSGLFGYTMFSTIFSLTAFGLLFGVAAYKAAPQIKDIIFLVIDDQLSKLQNKIFIKESKLEGLRKGKSFHKRSNSCFEVAATEKDLNNHQDQRLNPDSIPNI